MAPPQPHSSTIDTQSVEQLVTSFLELIQTLISSMEPKKQADCCELFASELIESHDIENRSNNIEKAIYWYRRALDIWTQESYPEKWASTQHKIGNGLQKRMCGDRGRNLDDAIECHRLALQIWTKEMFPIDWAYVQMSMGDAFVNRISGDRKTNIDEAIKCFQLALEIRTQESLPKDWALTKMKIGNALCGCISGNRRGDIDEAMKCYRQALQIITPEAMPQEWASLQMNMGNAFVYRISGNRRLNTDDAIACYRGALKIWTQDSTLQDWTSSPMNMGNVLQDRNSENRSVNIALGIECYRLALQIWNREAMPEYWVTKQMNMGNTMNIEISGDRGIKLDTVIECYRIALRMSTGESMPHDWVSTLTNLMYALRNEMAGDSHDNVNQAIEFYRQALEIWTRTSMPQDWAYILMKMGNTLQDGMSGDGQVNVDEAIECYRRALEIWPRKSMLLDWARTQMNLGNVLQDRISGDRRLNINEALECYRLSLEIFTLESTPLDWARTKRNMGNALCDRISGDRRVDLDEAIECYRVSLEFFSREAMLHDWACTQRNMGNALQDRISGDRRVNLDEAIECYQRSLQIFTGTSRLDWAYTQRNMGNAFFDRISGDRMVNLDEAIECYRLSLEVFNRKSMPIDWARTQRNLGNALQDRISGDSVVNADEAIECQKRTLEIWTRESSPLDWTLSQVNIGIAYLSHVAEGTASYLTNAKVAIENFFQVISLQTDPLTFLRGCQFQTQLYMRIGSVPEITAACEQGLHAVEYAKSLFSLDVLHSRHLEEEYAIFANNLMALHFHQGRYHKVVELFDQNKASLLLRLMSEWDDAGSKLSEQDRMKLEELKEHYQTLKYDQYLNLGKGKEYKEVMEQFRRVKRDVDNLIEIGDQDQRQDILGVPCEEMIEFMKKKNVIGIVFFYAGEYERLREGDSSSKSLHAICVWNGKVSGYVENKRLKYTRSHAMMKSFSNFKILRSENKKEMLKRRKDESEFLENLGQFISSILDDLKRNNPESNLPNRLLIVPQYILNKVPFCAVPVRTEFDGYTGEKPRFLGDVFRGGIWMVPSISIAVWIDRKKDKNTKKLGDCKIVSATCPSVLHRKQYDKTVREGIRGKVKNHVHISDPYPPRTKIKMSEDLKDCDILHLTCPRAYADRDISSGYWNPCEAMNRPALSFEPSESKIMSKAEDELKNLNMVDILGLSLKECNLVNVVACSEEAVSPLSRSDESLNIGTGFLVGGARNVICCAWPVQEIVAAIMMDRLYKNMCKSGNGDNGVWKIGEHLGEVQRWFRELTDEECIDLLEEYDPDGETCGLGSVNDFYCWGAFTLIGPPD